MSRPIYYYIPTPVVRESVVSQILSRTVFTNSLIRGL